MIILIILIEEPKTSGILYLAVQLMIKVYAEIDEEDLKKDLISMKKDSLTLSTGWKMVAKNIHTAKIWK